MSPEFEIGKGVLHTAVPVPTTKVRWTLPLCGTKTIDGETDTKEAPLLYTSGTVS